MNRAKKSISSAKKSTLSNITRNEEITESHVIIPPDGGWGWVVVAASFLCNFVIDGSLYTFGVFLDEMKASFNVHPTKIALANSLMSGFYSLLGPVTCALVNRFGFRIVGFIGGLLATLVLLISSTLTNLTMFLIIYGCIGGLSYGMVYVPSIVVIGFYFERWRALATSIAVCGSSVGIIVFPIIIKGILANFNWRVKFQILSVGFVLSCICALLYRPLKPVRVKPDRVVQLFNDTDDSVSSLVVDETEGFFSRYHNTMYPKISNVTDPNIPLTRKYSNTSSLFVMSVTTSKFEMQSEKQSTINIDNDTSLRSKCVKLCQCNCCKCDYEYKLPSHRPMYRDDALFTGSLYNIPEYSRSYAVPGVSNAISSVVDYHMSVTRATTQRDRAEDEMCCICCPISIKRTLATMMDVKLLYSPSFILLILSGFFTLFGMYTPFIYIVQRAKEKNINMDLAYYFLSVMGIANAIGRILDGVLSSLPFLSALSVSYITLFICGLATMLSYFLTDALGEFFYVSIFGLTIASLPTLRAIILVEMLGLENLTNAFGILMLFQGVASFISLPAAGAVANYTRSYNVAFLFSGAFILLSSILLMPIRRVSNWEKSEKE